MQNQKKQIILASKSPARSQLLAQAGIIHTQVTPKIDERQIELNIAPRPTSELAQHLAQTKAKSVSLSHPNALTIGADQIGEHDGSPLHQGQTLLRTREILQRLRAQTHRLHTSVCIALNGEIMWQHTEEASLKMRDFGDDELDEILRLDGENMKFCAGGYRLEGPAIRLFEAYQGDYFSILGLPLLPLISALRQKGAHI